jgi:hypothetical protein
VEGRRGRGLTDGGQQVHGWGFLSALSLVGHRGGGGWVVGDGRVMEEGQQVYRTKDVTATGGL